MNIHDLLDPREEEPEQGRLVHLAGPLAVASTLAGLAVLLTAATQLGNADLGTSIRARGCSASPLAGLVLFLVAGALLAIAPTLARLRHAGAVPTWDRRGLLFATPLPLLLALATVPGVLGCQVASDLAGLAVVGGALTGTGGTALAVGALVLLGASLSVMLHVSWALLPLGDPAPPPSIVEQAMLDAEDFEHDPHTRFHGVDSPENR
ncbi:MAG: hypothetical protein JWM25_1727 [Thermoleophilia bacterium]|nr:hypothetical protein [Thermoleophilia bacterium]MCZ4497142.1 hypothetical protein [Thermoleophilia bacterium]